MSDNIHSHETIHPHLETQSEPKPKTFLEKLPFHKEKETAKEKAEKDYINNLNIDNPEQSPYVIKSSKTIQAPTPTKSKSYLELEKILSDDLESYYQNLDPAKQEQFKIKGEEAASKIEEMIATFKIKARTVIQIIKQWLLMIPGINKFFLEQEAKIKTQKIIAFARQYKKENKNKW